jgi:hypothetical protein
MNSRLSMRPVASCRRARRILALYVGTSDVSQRFGFLFRSCLKPTTEILRGFDVRRSTIQLKPDDERRPPRAKSAARHFSIAGAFTAVLADSPNLSAILTRSATERASIFRIA